MDTKTIKCEIWHSTPASSKWKVMDYYITFAVNSVGNYQYSENEPVTSRYIGPPIDSKITDIFNILIPHLPRPIHYDTTNSHTFTIKLLGDDDVKREMVLDFRYKKTYSNPFIMEYITADFAIKRPNDNAGIGYGSSQHICFNSNTSFNKYPFFTDDVDFAVIDSASNITVTRSHFFTGANLYFIDIQQLGRRPEGYTAQNFISDFFSFTSSPVSSGDYSDVEVGGGVYDFSSDSIPVPDVPYISSSTTGFCRAYSPSISQLTSLSSYLWSSSFDVSSLKKLVANPMDLIIGLSILPFTPNTGPAQNIKVGSFDTGISVNTIQNQYQTLDFGTIKIDEQYGSVLDYDPYTKTSIYLPYIGTRELKTDDIMGKTIGVRYLVDIMSGSSVAYITVDGTVLYTYTASLIATVPINSTDWSSLINSSLNLVTSGASAFATGNAGKLVGAVAQSVTSMKPTIQRTGSVGGSSGILSIQYPYLIIEAPRQSLPENYNHFEGYPSNITAKLSTLKGYTQVEKIFLDDLSATTEEKNLIESILKGGILI